MRAVVYDSPRSFEVVDVPTPSFGSDEVLVRVLAAGVCGTDAHLHDGEFDPVYPLTPGHEVAGEVIEVGTEVTSPRIGDRVVIDNRIVCGLCSECRIGRPAYCVDIVVQGINAPGAFAEYMVAAAARCFVVNDLDPEVAVFAEPLACVIHGLDVLALRPGSRVLVFGAGPTGLLLTQLLASSGAGSLTVAAPTPAKLEIAAARGADVVLVLVDRNDPSVAAERLRELAGPGFVVVVDATGRVSVLEQAIPLLGVGGTVLVYGMTAEKAEWRVSPYELFRRELVIKGSFAQQFSFDRAVAALRGSRVDTSGMITHRFDLEHYADALAASSCIKAIVAPSAIGQRDTTELA